MPIPLGEDLLDQFAAQPPTAGLAPDAGFGETDTRLRALWLAEDGVTPLGDPAHIGALDYAPREAFGADGLIEHVERPVGLVADIERPPAAAFLQLTGAGREMLVPAAALAAAPPLAVDRKQRFGAAVATFAFPVFAERFTDADAFFAKVGELDHWVRTIPPFTEPAVSARFAIDAYFWRSDPDVGMFETRDIAYDCSHPPANAVIFLGNNATAHARLNHLMLERRYGLVLMNSRVRGGAGGMAAFGYPAWASITACPSEAWQAVALHEMGHALGLADEYVDAGRAGEAFGGEPNCASSATVATAPWRARFTSQPAGEASVYPEARQQRVRARTEPQPADDFVGLFQGARYSTNFYRPSWNCLMKQLNVLRFCPVCADHIRARLTAA
jgi:hypothetical protein